MREKMGQREYRFSPALPGGWSASNHAQGFRIRAGAGGLEVASSAGGARAWTLRWRLAAWGREGCPEPVPPVEPVARGPRLEYCRGSLVEWYINDATGLEQGFTVQEPPAAGVAAAPLVLELALDGTLKAEEPPSGTGVGGDTHLFRPADAGGHPAPLRYSRLVVVDAAGRRLDAMVTVDDSTLVIRIDDEGAAYPLLVDPLLDAPASTLTVVAPGAEFGTSVASAGDVNGDGFDDVIVGAPFFDGDGLDEGRAFLYLGSALGLSSTPAWTGEPNQEDALFGASVSSAGDVNGDGFDDVIIGAPFFDGGSQDDGRAFVFLGSADGLSETPAWSADGEIFGASFGLSVASADFNGDGFSDVIVSAPDHDTGGQIEGRVSLFLGSPGGPSLEPDWFVEGDQIASAFGESVAGAGDVNGDGFGDVLIGAPDYENGQDFEGRAFLYLGSPSPFSFRAAWTAESDQVGATFGGSVATAGDVNGDGFSDVIIGAPEFEDGESFEGAAFLYPGSSTGLATDPAWVTQGDQDLAAFGAAVATAGDVNADGFSDVIVGAPDFDDGVDFVGAVFLYLGSPTGLSVTADATFTGTRADAALGDSVATAGDVDRDGFGDVIVGAPFEEGDELNQGRAYVFRGEGTSLFRRGDVDGDGEFVISDAIKILNFLFLGTDTPGCIKSADVDDTGELMITDAAYLLRFLFLGGAEPPPPFAACGPDPIADALPCQAFPVCR